jgi:tight adherence protein B
VVIPALASACALLALVAALPPAAPGSRRVVELLARPPAGRRSVRGLPAVSVAAVGAVAGLVALGPAGALAGAAAGGAWRGWRTRARTDRAATVVATELADAVGRIADELRAGAHPAAALAGVRADGPVARAVLGSAATAAALGDGVPAALEAEAVRCPEVARHLRRLGAAWALADRHGIPLAELLAGVHADMRWRVAHVGRVRAQLAGPRATAAVLTALPGLGIGLGQLVGAGPVDVLRTGVLGQLLVLLGVGLTAGGAVWTGHILRSAVPR